MLDWRTYEKKKLQKETIAAKSWALDTDKQNIGLLVPPLYLSSNFEYKKLGENQEYEYTRERNPTRDHLIKGV